MITAWRECYPLYVIDTLHNHNNGKRAIYLNLFWRKVRIRIPLPRGKR